MFFTIAILFPDSGWHSFLFWGSAAPKFAGADAARRQQERKRRRGGRKKEKNSGKCQKTLNFVEHCKEVGSLARSRPNFGAIRTIAPGSRQQISEGRPSSRGVPAQSPDLTKSDASFAPQSQSQKLRQPCLPTSLPSCWTSRWLGRTARWSSSRSRPPRRSGSSCTHSVTGSASYR